MGHKYPSLIHVVRGGQQPSQHSVSSSTRELGGWALRSRQGFRNLRGVENHFCIDKAVDYSGRVGVHRFKMNRLAEFELKVTIVAPMHYTAEQSGAERPFPTFTGISKKSRH